MQVEKEKKKIMMDKRKKRKKIIKKLSIITLILIAGITILLLIEYLPQITSFRKEVQVYLIEDECGLVVGTLIHQIKDEGECKIECRNECGVRKETFYKSEFTTKENACNICNCYCR